MILPVQQAFSPAGAHLPAEYRLTFRLGGADLPFRQTLRTVAIGPGDSIYALGDGEVRTYDSKGEFKQSRKAAEGALCLAVGPEGQLYFGAEGRVYIQSPSGKSIGGFGVDHSGQPSPVTSIQLYKREILIGDAAARCIRRCDAAGRVLATIGTQSKTGGFMLPNRSLDFGVDSKGVVWAGDSGRHRVTSWTLDGAPVGAFGKFGQQRLEDFVGCCNPVNIAVAANGKIVTGEKVAARVKVFEPTGRLLAVIGPGPFDAMCTFIRLAVDSKGRIFAVDPVRRVVSVFSLMNEPEPGREPERKPSGS